MRASASRELARGIGIAALLAGCSTTSSQPPQTWDGLEKQATQIVDGLYVRPAATLTSYRTVMVDPPVVSFDKNWRLDRGITVTSHPISPAEVADIRNALSNGFLAIFEKELATCGYATVKQVGADTLHVSPA